MQTLITRSDGTKAEVSYVDVRIKQSMIRDLGLNYVASRLGITSDVRQLAWPMTARWTR